VDDAARVSVGEPGGDPGRDALRLLDRERALAREPVCERAAAEALEHHVRPPVRGLPVVAEDADVLVRERGDRASLTAEASVVGARREQLDRYGASELAVGRAPDLRHGAAPEQLVEPVTASDLLLGRHG
jgi:hypothetical protein